MNNAPDNNNKNDNDKKEQQTVATNHHHLLPEYDKEWYINFRNQFSVLGIVFICLLENYTILSDSLFRDKTCNWLI